MDPYSIIQLRDLAALLSRDQGAPESFIIRGIILLLVVAVVAGLRVRSKQTANPRANDHAG